MSEQPVSVGAFLRDLRWMLPSAVGLMLLLSLLGVGGMEPLEALLIALATIVVFGPMLWLYWERALFVRYAKDPAFWKFFGGSALWAIFSFAVIALILYAFGIE